MVPDSENYVHKKFLLREDVQICDDILVVKIKWSKTIHFGERVLKIPLLEIQKSDLCPLKAFITETSPYKSDPRFPPNI